MGGQERAADSAVRRSREAKWNAGYREEAGPDFATLYPGYLLTCFRDTSFSVDISLPGATMTPYCQKLLPVCEELGQTVLDIVGQANITITEHKLLDPKLLAVALLSRTLGNFRGAVRLIEQSLLVEARVLTRCCFENQLLIGGLYSKGYEFAQKIKTDDVAGRRN